MTKSKQGKITDESVAEALGWKQFDDGHRGRWCSHPRHKNKAIGVWPWPAFTTSLDAIVSEIEARGLTKGLGDGWSVNSGYNGKLGAGYRAYLANGNYTGWADTAPLALCQALLNYLRESGHAK